MKVVIAILAIFAIIGIAAANGWLTMTSDSNRTTIQIDKAEIQRDANAAAEDVKEAAEEVGDQIHDLGKPTDRSSEQPEVVEPTQVPN